jgi:hypothetical protein
MSFLTKELVPVNLDTHQWQSRVVNTPFLTKDGERVSPPNEVLTSVPGQGHAIEFEFQTSALRPATINIHLSVSIDAHVIVLINNKTVRELDLEAAKEPPPLAHRVTVEATEWTEESELSRLRLIITYQGEQGTTAILLGGNGDQLRYKPHVVQEWVPAYALQGILFSTLAWGIVLALAIIILAQLNIIGGTLRFYAVISTVIVWIAGLLGLPDVARIPLRPILRRLYFKTRSQSDSAISVPRNDPPPSTRPGSMRRPLVLLVLSLILVGVGIYAGLVIYSLVIHQYYSTLINRARVETNPDASIRRAFVLAPWRKEAQALFEKRAFNLRNPSDTLAFRNYLKDFVDDKDVKAAIQSAQSSRSVPFYLNKSADSTFNDPVVWYATLLPEAEGDESVLIAQAISMLAARRTLEAQIQQSCFQLYLDWVAENHEAYKSHASQLQDLITQNRNSQEIRSTHSYQVACDILGAFYIDEPCNLSESAAWFQNVIESRKRLNVTRGGLLWPRPPEKLLLYYMFRSLGGLTGTEVDNAKYNYLDNEKCKGLRQVFMENLATPYPEFKEEKAWREGTFLDDKFDTTIIESLETQGWRY